MAYGARRRVMVVFSEILSLRPSTAIRKLWLRLLTRRVITTSSQTITGRVLRLCDATGDRQKVPERGTMMGPPTLREYPVEPVGVLMMRPSDI